MTMDDNKLSAEQLASLSNAQLTELAQKVSAQLANRDWQKAVADLRNSGHLQTFHTTAPPLLRKFLKLELNLDEELQKQSGSAPIMSNLRLDPRRPRGDEARVAAFMSSQDDGANMRLEVHPSDDHTMVAFGVKSMLTFRFNLPQLDKEECVQFLDLVRRDRGITFLWTPKRWEDDFLIFVKGEFFTRVYAFGTSSEATVRVSTEVIGGLMDWLEKAWFPRERRRLLKRTSILPSLSEEVLSGKASSPVVDESLKLLAQQLMGLDMAGRGTLIPVAGDKVEVLSRIYAASGPDEIAAELHRHPDLCERIREKIGDLTIPLQSPTDPELDTW